MILVAELNRQRGRARCLPARGHDMPRPRRPEHETRSPIEVVEQAGVPGQALMQFIAERFEEAGFPLSTSDWPVLHVQVAGRDYVIAEGAGAMRNARQVADGLRQLLVLVDR